MVQSKLIKISRIELNTGQIDGLPKNPRFIKDDKYFKLVKSISDHPEMLNYRELLVYPVGDRFVIIGGNMRYRACKELGFQELPCKVIPKETTIEQLRAYTIKDNGDFGEWDFDLLANEWDAIDLNNWGIDIPTDDDEPKEKKIGQQLGIKIVFDSEDEMLKMEAELNKLKDNIRFAFSVSDGKLI